MNYFLQTKITRYTVWRLPLVMDVRMYDNGYVRFTALPTGILLFPNASLRSSPPLKGGMGGCPSAFGYRVPGITINH